MILSLSLTMFLSAVLLFSVQPLLGKLVLPLLGGAPAVWTTCMFFFQGVLLLGYSYAHFTTRWLSLRWHVILHIGLLLVAALVLPMRLNAQAIANIPHDTNPIPWLLCFLSITAGIPFLVLSATAPLLQRWFAQTDHPQARDPYFLYSASNAGSLLGLLSYPLWWERKYTLAGQNQLWTAGFFGLVVLLAGCGIALSRAPAAKIADSSPLAADRPTWGDRRRWIVLAFVPSSLMLGVTTYITTDVAAIPLLWVVPLMLYLVTFVLVFARRPRLAPVGLGCVMSLIVVVLLVAMIVEATHPAALLIPLHLLAFFAAAWICHSELFRLRPDKTRLTEFYLCLSIGGVLGSIFNGLLAPIVFQRVLEYPLVLALACAVRPVNTSSRRSTWLLPASVGVLTVALILVSQYFAFPPGRAGILFIFGLPALAAYRFMQTPRHYGIALEAMLLGSLIYTGTHGHTLRTTRNFFGVLRVTDNLAENCRILIHGSTLHGRQCLGPAQRTDPFGYYHRAGPIGQAFERLDQPHSVAVIGLGAGALACYAQPQQTWSFYEIDPATEQIARDTRYFTYLHDSRAREQSVILGDARLRLADAAHQQFDVLVLDAFSSDAIPVHLLTREALQLYLDKLTPDGWLAFHITNRCLDLRPVVANLAADAQLTSYCRDDLVATATGQDPSRWVVLARRPQQLAALARDPRWQPLATRPQIGLWTDEFSNILSVLR